MDIKCRMIQEKDKKAVAEFFKELTLFHLDGLKGYLNLREYSFERTLEKMETFLSQEENAGIIVAESGDEIVGLLAYYVLENSKLTNFDYDRFLEIDRIIVSLDFRSKGIGEALMEEAEKKAKELGIKRLILDLADFNVKGEKFYKNQGYKSFMTIYGKNID